MSRAAFTYGLAAASEGRRHWRSLEELADAPEFRRALEDEFPEGAQELAGVSRRSFLSLMGASLGLAGLSGCRRPVEKILPYAKAPEDVVPGRPQFYATAMALGGGALGLVVESHEGRPTKIEGNALHPSSLGGTTAFAQAAVLDLYDPDRSRNPSEKGAARTWADAAKALVALGAKHREAGGKGLAVLVYAHRSPTLAAALADLRSAMPSARVVRWDPFPRDAIREGSRMAFGEALEPLPDFAKAKVIVSLDSDFLWVEGEPVRQARDFASNRRLEKASDGLNRLYAVESTYTITGAAADHRLRLRRSEIPRFAASLARELSALGLDLGATAAAGSHTHEKWARAVAKDLLENRGRAIVVAGAAQPPAVHALVAQANHALSAPVSYVPPFEDAPEGPAGLVSLAESMRSGETTTLLVLGTNPAFDAPADAGFGAAMSKATVVHLGSHRDETGTLATWHLNRAHDLESWSDVRSLDGMLAVVQPLVAPLHAGRTDAEVVRLLLGEDRKAHDLVRAGPAGAGGENAWRRALHDGVVAGSAFPAKSVSPNPGGAAEAFAKLSGSVPEGMEITFHPDSHALDGRFANNGWLQELPDPMTRLAWDNAALFSPETARKLGVSEGDLVELAAGGRTLTIAALVQPGQADDSIALAVGQGRRAGGKVLKGVGFDAYRLRSAAGAGALAGVKVTRTGRTHDLARTQHHHVMEGRGTVREASLHEYRANPDFAKGEGGSHAPAGGRKLPVLPSMYADTEYKGHRWGMVIDLNACTGCGACVAACQSENNGPLVGKEGVLRSREMHWLRIDRYFSQTPGPGLVHEPEADPQVVFQPVACQECENAPCENVCPVGATTHTSEGLNDMAYNRCVGTRYCANNCPFKVRRFNFFNYQKDVPELRKMQFNPDVTVRSRGVMEKCTYCVQRIQEAKIAVHKDGRERVADGAVVTACQQSCPSQAIRFGDLNDPKSAASKAAALPRDYRMLEDLNVRPRTSFLARVRNPNPDMEGA